MADDPRQPADGGSREGDPTTMPLAGYLADGRICRDLKCCRCGYNLRTLPRDANCPECDLAVLRSLYHLDLRYADPRWLARIGGGLRLAAWMPPLLFAVALSIEHLGAPAGHGLIHILVLLTALTPIAGWIAGLWLLGSPEPHRVAAKGARAMVRVTAMLFLSMMLASFTWPRGSPFMWITGIGLPIASLLTIGAIIHYSLELSKRLLTSQDSDDLRLLTKIALLAVAAAAIGFGLNSLDIVSAIGRGITGASPFFLGPIAVLVDICLLRLAYRLMRTAAKSRGNANK